MAEPIYGYAEGGRVVFDAQLLEDGAAQLREQYDSDELVQMLLLRIASPRAFGSRIPGAADAMQRMAEFLTSVQEQMGRVGMDMADLASRAVAAGNLARGADLQTMAAATQGGG
ncbi:MAG: hypothetical protein ACT4NY_09975 [Pseudonocardiales bacterium]